MKNLLSLAAVAGIVVATFAPAANAEEFVARYTYLVNGVQVPASTVLPAQTLTQPAVIGNSCGTVLSQPAIINDACGSAVLTQPAVLGGKAPIMVEDHENIVPHFFHLGVWPLVDFSIF